MPTYPPGSPYPSTQMGQEMAAKGIPIYGGGTDPSVYQQGLNGGGPVISSGGPVPAAQYPVQKLQGMMTPDQLAEFNKGWGAIPAGGGARHAFAQDFASKMGIPWEKLQNNPVVPTPDLNPPPIGVPNGLPPVPQPGGQVGGGAVGGLVTASPVPPSPPMLPPSDVMPFPPAGGPPGLLAVVGGPAPGGMKQPIIGTMPPVGGPPGPGGQGGPVTGQPVPSKAPPNPNARPGGYGRRRNAAPNRRQPAGWATDMVKGQLGRYGAPPMTSFAATGGWGRNPKSVY